MKSLSNRIKFLIVPLVLLCFILVFFFDVLFGSKTLFTGDNISLNIPGKFFLRTVIENKQLPLWNPYLFSGMPFLADINFGVLAPINILYFIFDPFKAHTLNVVIALWLIGIFMYMYCRMIQIPRISALISSVIFMFSGSVFINTLNTAILNVIMWLPLVMWGCELFVRKNKLHYGLLVSVICALQFFSGHIQYSYYTWLLVVLYMIFRCQPFSVVASLKRLLTIFLPLMFLVAIQLLPFLEYSQLTTRPTQNILYSAGETSIVSFIRIILPNFFGVLKDGTSWGATADISGFIGIIPLLLIISLIKLRKTNLIGLFFLVTSVLFLFIALGRYSPLYQAAYYLLPFYSRFRSPGTILILYTFGLSVVAGYAVDCLFQSINKYKRELVSVIRTILFILIPLVLTTLTLKLVGYSYFVKFLHLLQRLHKVAFFTRFLEYSSYRMDTIYNLWVNNILIELFFVFLFLSLVYYASKKGKLSSLQQILILLLITSELMFYAGNIHISASNELLKPNQNIHNILKKDGSFFRIVTLKDEPKKPTFARPDYFIQESVKSMTFMQTDTNLFYETASMDGYASMVYQPYAQYVMDKPPTDPTGIEITPSSFDKWDDLNVKYVLTAGRYVKELNSNPKFKLTSTYQQPFLKRNFYIYQNMQAKDRVEVVDNPEASASIISYKPNEILIKTRSDKTSTLLLRDTYYPGWSAVVNYEKADIKPYGVFRSISIPAGVSYVKMYYQPLLIVIGGMISVTSWLICLVFLFFSLFKEQK